MQKLKIFLMMFLLLSNLYGYQNRAEIHKFYSRNEIVEGLETRIPFEAEVWLENRDRVKSDFFYINIDEKYSYIKLEGIKAEGINSKVIGNRIYFEGINEKPLKEDMKILLKGNLIINWREKNKNNEIMIGYIENSQSRVGRESVYLQIDDSYFKKLQKLDIKVKDMDLGTGVAGHTLDSRSGGESAIISVIGNKEETVKITIPRNAFIRNKYGDTLIVNLSFEERYQQKGDKLELIRVLNGRGSNESKGESGEIAIRGICKTKEESFGKYEGSFVVRVTYND